MIDFHTHILPGLDDGPIDVSESIIMATRLAEFGYKTICCTPHCISGYYDVTPQKVREATLMLQADLDNADIQLELCPGIEYCLDEYFSEYAEELLPLGPTKLVLCEAPQQANHECVQNGLQLIVEKGFVPLVAHPERTQYFYEMLTERGTRDEERDSQVAFVERKSEARVPSVLSKPKGFWARLFSSRAPRPASREAPPSHVPRVSPDICLFHANLGSFTGYYGPKVQAQAYELLKLGAFNAIASDLHEGRNVSEVLVRDKFDNNPLLKKLAEFDGEAPEVMSIAKPVEGEQMGMF